MNLLFVADGRSPTARSWINNVLQDSHRVSLISTYPCQEMPGLADFHILPIAFSRLASYRRSPASNADHPPVSSKQRLVKFLRPLLMDLRYYLGPLSLVSYQKQYRRIIDQVSPEVIHALRIPFEGMLARQTPSKYPLIVSIWGNDLTLHAGGSFFMNRLTEQVLSRTDGLLADTKRDIRLARNWGFHSRRPTMVIPGCGGVDLTGIEKARMLIPKGLLKSIPQDKSLIINPRGLRPGSLRTDVFFQAIHLLAERNPDLLVVCPNMEGQPEAQKYVSDFHLDQFVRLLPQLSQPELWWLFTRAEILISPGAHDGVPNSFLEGLAAGCFPIAGDIESMREWIIPGVNGLLYPIDDSRALSEAISSALDNSRGRQEAARVNRKLISDRADRTRLRSQISTFYQQVLE